MKSFASFFLFLFFSVTTSYGQEIEDTYEDEQQEIIIEEEEFYVPINLNFFEGSFSMIFPQGRFAEKVDQSVYYGFSLAYLRQLKKENPAFIGVELYQSFMGSLSRNYEYSVNGEIVDVTGRVNSNALGLNLIGRYYPELKLGPVEPFFEIHFGSKWFYSYLTERGFFEDGEEYSMTDFLKGDLVLAYGGAIGFQIYLDQDVYLSVKGSYQVSNSAEFNRRLEDDVTIFPLLPIDGFESVNTVTNHVKIDIGFTYLY